MKYCLWVQKFSRWCWLTLAMMYDLWFLTFFMMFKLGELHVMKWNVCFSMFWCFYAYLSYLVHFCSNVYSFLYFSQMYRPVLKEVNIGLKLGVNFSPSSWCHDSRMDVSLVVSFLVFPFRTMLYGMCPFSFELL